MDTEGKFNQASYQTFTHSRLFPESELASIVDFGFAPLANSLQKSASDLAPVAPLHLCFSEKAACAELSVTVDPAQLFSSYLWVTGTSVTAAKYSSEFCERLLKQHPSAKKIAEVASNDGTFLRPFLERGLQVLGIDPAQNIAEKANAEGILTEVEFFDAKTALALKSKYGSYDLMVARNVLPHVPDPREILIGFERLLSADGIGAIEFHSARTIFEELHYDSIYHEHVTYLTLTCLSRLLRNVGLQPYDIFKSPISGGSTVVLFSKTPRQVSAELTDELQKEAESGVLTLEGWQQFSTRVRAHISKFKDLLSGEFQSGKRILGYGASARSMTLIHASDTARMLVEIVDNSPLKQGLYSSTGNIPIVTSDTANFNDSVVVLLAWNFTDELLRLLKEKHKFSGDVVIPLPGDPKIVRI